MAEAVLSEGLVLAVTNASGGVFPFACAKNATLSISRDTLELAPRTNGVFREYIQNRMSFTVSGNGLVKMAESNMQPITFFAQNLVLLYSSQFFFSYPNEQFLAIYFYLHVNLLFF